MKKRFQNVCAGAGLTMLIMMVGMGESNPVALIIWLGAACVLLYKGCAFNFQKKNWAMPTVSECRPCLSCKVYTLCMAMSDGHLNFWSSRSIPVVDSRLFATNMKTKVILTSGVAGHGQSTRQQTPRCTAHGFLCRWPKTRAGITRPDRNGKPCRNWCFGIVLLLSSSGLMRRRSQWVLSRSWTTSWIPHTRT